MDKFTKSTQKTTGGIDPNEWFNGYYVQNKGLSGTDEVTVTASNGSLQKINRSDTAIMFKDFVIHREGSSEYNFYDVCTFGTVGSNSVMAKPVALVSCAESWNPGFLDNLKHKHTLTKDRGPQMYQSQPVCLYDKAMSDEDLLRTRVLLEQCGRFWVSAGRNDIDMSLHHTANMYICQQSSLLYYMFEDMLRGVTFNDLSKHPFYLLYYHAKSLVSFMDLFPEIKKPMAALSQAEYSCDVLQRLVSCAISGYKLTLEDYVRMIELSLKRSFKRHSGEKSFITSFAPGLTAILFFGPYYGNIFFGQEGPADEFQKFNTDFQVVIKKVKERTADLDEVNEINVIFIEEFLKHNDVLCKLTVDNIRKLYTFCMNFNNRNVDFDMEDIVKAPVVKFGYDNKNIKIRSHPLLNRCRLVVDGDDIALIAKDPSGWTGIQLTSPGVYLFTPTVLGYAKEGKNNTRKEHLTAVVSFTTSNNIMPTKRYMISSAGEISAADKKIYNYKQNLDLTKPFKLTIERTEFTVEQDNKVFLTSSTRLSTVLLVMKYVKLAVEYRSNDMFELDTRVLARLVRRGDYNDKPTKSKKKAKSSDAFFGFGLPPLVIDE